MDLNQFLIENVSGLIAIISVIIGGIITSVPIIVFQTLQRKWKIEDENRQWRRSRLMNRLSPIQDWLDNTLRFIQAFTQWFNDDNPNKQPSNFLDIAEDDLRQDFQRHSRDEAIIISHAISTGDEELLTLLNGFKKIRSDYIKYLRENDKTKIEANRYALEAIASKTSRRLEFLLEEAQPIGGNYHKKLESKFLKKRGILKNH